MLLKVTVEYNEGIACYELTSETAGIYNGKLVSYNGQESVSPPSTITLIKSVRNWTGSTEIDLLNAIGKEIDDKEIY